MADEVKIHTFDNGITLLAEKMDFVSSAAFSILVPLGAATDPDGYEGCSSILSEMFHKGAGPWDTKALSQEFENIGAHRSHAAGIEVSVFSGAVLGENLVRALDLYGTVLLEPRFPEEEFESVRQLALSELKALEDQPSSKVMVELAQHFYPAPFGRSQLGTVPGVTTLTPEVMRDYYRQSFLPHRAIISVAGKFDWDEVRQVVQRKFGKWTGKGPELPSKPLAKTSSNHHVSQDTNQLQIALAYPSVDLNHPDYYTARVVVSILSGGMSGRLFIEVREKRGLVYRVSASHSATKGRAAIFTYAGTTPDNAEETLRVIINELRKLGEGFDDDELNRAKADLKSRVVMQGEASSARASSLVNDWWNLRRVRSLQEIKTAIDGVTNEMLIKHVQQFPPSPITLVTLGKKPLELSQ